MTDPHQAERARHAAELQDPRVARPDYPIEDVRRFVARSRAMVREPNGSSYVDPVAEARHMLELSGVPLPAPASTAMSETDIRAAIAGGRRQLAATSDPKLRTTIKRLIRELQALLDDEDDDEGDEPDSDDDQDALASELDRRMGITAAGGACDVIEDGQLQVFGVDARAWTRPRVDATDLDRRMLGNGDDDGSTAGKRGSRVTFDGRQQRFGV